MSTNVLPPLTEAAFQLVRPADGLAELAVAINAEHEAGEVATRKGLAHFRAAGEALLQAKKKCGHGNWLPWLKANVRFDRMTASRYMRVAASWAKCNTALHLADALRLLTEDADGDGEPTPPEYVTLDQSDEAGEDVRRAGPDDFFTASTVIEPARRAMGGIDLDPASHAIANGVVRAKRFYAAADDGLSREWAGRVWLNPPFSQWRAWVPKIVGEWRSGRVEALCVLCATRTLTAQYLAAIHEACTALCVLHGRIPFWGERATSGPDDGHAVFYFGPDVAAFAREFGAIGHVYDNAGTRP
jgi:hypothetical protein